MTEQDKSERSFEALAARLPDTLEGVLGIELVEVSDERITMRMPITASARQPFGLVHGGVYMVLAESAASWHACWGVDLNEQYPVGIEISGSHLRAAKDGHLHAVGRVLRRGQALIVHQVEIFHEETGKRLCVARVTNYYKKADS